MSDVGQALIEANAITQEQLQEAKATGSETVAHAIVDKRWVEEREFVSIIARSFELPEADLATMAPNDEALAIIPQSLFKSTGCLPLKKDGAMLHIATCDPGNDRKTDRIARSSGLSLKVFVAGPRALEALAGKVYGTDCYIFRSPEETL